MKSSLLHVTFKLIQIIRELKEEVLKLKELLIKEGYNPEELQCKWKMTPFSAGKSVTHPVTSNLLELHALTATTLSLFAFY